ncbi:mucin-5AC isoform X1 [Vespa velutina]|uniref:mucin-5AC isoform X1 n=1 Tax=Vespa velutina TaxID=202808 RepID=UPI001FB22553|nr:mucin-5AC isoform X1 [Vespa velutina]XP_047353016.1 mucin-5AC isoform X1 [Vespa velutina]
MNVLVNILLICVAVTVLPGHCERKESQDDAKARLPEFLSELDLASLEASEEDVEALKKIAKRLAPEKNGEYQVYQVFFGNEDLLKEWLKGAGVSGQPGVDFPTFTTIPATSFSCRGLKGGYYADLETNCQVFHICDNGRKISFLCPNGTIFQQSQLICDWWFKVDCSKSTELYEQSAEQLAEEERKRTEEKKMKSEFHRTVDHDELDYHQGQDNYDGRQNGRTNPFGQSARPNQIQDNTDGFKSQFKQSNVFDQTNGRSGNQFVQNSNSNGFQSNEQDLNENFNPKPKQGPTFNYRTINRQQNQLVDTQNGKYNQYNPSYEEKFQESTQDNQDQSNNSQDYYGSAGTQNVALRNERPIGRNTKTRTNYARNLNNLNSPTQKATPAYMETTTFRTTTSSPVKEYQQFAESAAFVSNRGNYYNNNAANRQYYYQSYNNQESTTRDSTTTTKEKTSSPVIRTRFSIPPFPGPTFAPIYKPRTTTVQSHETTLQYTTTTEKTLDSTDYYRQPYTTETSYGFGGVVETVATTNRPETEDYQTSTESISTAALNGNYHENSEIQAAYRTDLDTSNPDRETYSNYYRNNNEYNRNKMIEDDQETTSYTTTRSNVNTENYRDYTEDVGTTAASIDYSNDILDRQKSTGSETETKIDAKEATRNLPSYRANSINLSTEKPSRSTQQYSSTGKTLSPYDTSFTYKQGKVMSTLGPYIPFTKNYIHSSTSTPTTITTAKPPVYTATVPSFTSTVSNYRNSKNLISKSKQYFSSSSTNKLKGSSSSSYLPESRSTLRIGSALENRPANEREHVLDMLHSLQGLENDVNTSVNSRTSLSTASGPSTLHSLALYFATASENFASRESTESNTDRPEETVETSTEKRDESTVELPKSILTQQTVESYAELFKLNNALEINDTRIEDSNEFENSNDDLDLQQSEGPVNGANKTNGTKLRELAQVFTHALSAYLQDPDTFKKVLTDIRPTDPNWTTESDQSETTTSYPTTVTEEFPSVTKEKDEVLDFSEDVNGTRRRKPTSVYPSVYQAPSIAITSSTYKPYLSQRDYYGSTLPPVQAARRDFYTTGFPETYRRDVYNSTLSPARSISSVSQSTINTVRSFEDNGYQTTTWLPPKTQNSYYTTTIAPTENTLDQTTTSSLNDLSNNNDYYESSTLPADNNFAYVVNTAFNIGNDNRIPVSSVETSDHSGSSKDDYFPVEYKSGENQYDDTSNGTTNRSDPYGKHVKSLGITPIHKNYVPSSTPAYYLQYAQDSRLGNKSERFGTPHYFKPEDNNNDDGSRVAEVSNSIISSSTTSIPPKRISNNPFRIRYYDSRIPDESLVTARSSYQNFRTSQNRVEGNIKQTDKTTERSVTMTSISSSNIGLDPITTTVIDFDDSSHVTTVTRNASNNNPIQNNTASNVLSNDHWTSSPMVTQLWESTIFIDPKRINHGLEDDPSSKEITSNESFSTLKPTRSSTLDSLKNKIFNINTYDDATKSSITSEDISTPWQWTHNNDDSPTTFTLLPSVFTGENTATPTPIYTTRSSITTTITSSVTSTNTIPKDNALVSLLPYATTTSSASNTSDNEVVKAKRIFGKLNESSSDTLMKVMKQADTNETVRQLVLLLINHCNGPMNKTMEEEKEQLLNALLRMPVNRFSTEESREIVAGINKLTLPIGRRSSSRSNEPDSRMSSTTPRSSEPSITTFRSKQGRKFRTTTDNPSVFSRRSDDPDTEETIDSLSETSVSDNRALDLLRSLYSVAAKWG